MFLPMHPGVLARRKTAVAILEAMATTETTGPSLFQATPPQYAALTRACAVVDRSERGKLALTGPEAKSFLAGQVTNDIEGLTPGSGCYAALLTHKGKMLADLRVLD